MDRKDQVPQVNTPGADQLTLAAQHAFHDFLFQLMGFPSLDECMHPSDIEFCKMSGRTGCSAAPASHAQADGRFKGIDEPGHFPVVCIEINLPVLGDRVAERFHAEFILNMWQPAVLWRGHR